MDVPTRSETIQITTAGTLGGALGGALGALAGTAAVWMVVMGARPLEDSSLYPLEGAQAAMAVVVAALVAVVLGILVGLVLGMALGSMSWDLLDRGGLAVLIVACLLAELLVLMGLRGLVAGREVGLADFAWTAFLPGLCASPLPAIALMAAAFEWRRLTG